MIAVGYCRASSDKQERSVSEQEAEIKKFCHAKRHRLLRCYVDDGWEGDDFRRPAFLDLMRDAVSRTCDFELIIVWDQGRFSRFKAKQAVPYFNALEQADVSLESITEGKVVDPSRSDMGAELKTYVTQIQKSQYLEDLSENVCRGKVNQGKRGVFGGHAPYGTRYRADGRLERDPVRSKILVAIYQWILAGWRLSAICRRLNQSGVPSPFAGFRGQGRWWPVSLKVIVRNPVYYGERYFGRRQHGKIFSINADGWSPVPRDKRKKNITSTNPIKPEVSTWHGRPLVSREDWDAVQSILDGRSHVRSTRNENSLPLVGIMRCGECGSPMITHRICRRGRVWEYYRCAWSRSGVATMLGRKTHGGYAVPAGLVWTTVVDEVQHYLSDQQIRTICNEVERSLREDRTNGKASIPDLEERLVQLERNRAKIKKNMVYADGPEAIGAFSAELTQLSAEITSVRSQVSALKAIKSEAARGTRVTVKAVRQYLQRIRDDVTGPRAVEIIRSIVREVVVNTVPHPKAKKGAKRKRMMSNQIKITLDFGDNQSLSNENASWIVFQADKLLSTAVIRLSLAARHTALETPTPLHAGCIRRPQNRRLDTSS